jgi:hypothetical protein
MERLGNRIKSPWLAAPSTIDQLLPTVTNTQLVEGCFLISFIVFPLTDVGLVSLLRQ